MTYTGAWTASSSSALSTRLSETVTVPAGTYIIIAKTPVIASGTSTVFVCINNTGDMALIPPGITYSMTMGIRTFSNQTSVEIRSGTEGGQSWSYLERGFLQLTRLQ